MYLITYNDRGFMSFCALVATVDAVESVALANHNSFDWLDFWQDMTRNKVHYTSVADNAYNWTLPLKIVKWTGTKKHEQLELERLVIPQEYP